MLDTCLCSIYHTVYIYLLAYPISSWVCTFLRRRTHDTHPCTILSIVSGLSYILNGISWITRDSWVLATWEWFGLIGKSFRNKPDLSGLRSECKIFDTLYLFLLLAYRSYTCNLKAVQWYPNPGLAKYLFRIFRMNESIPQGNSDQDTFIPVQEPSGQLRRRYAFLQPWELLKLSQNKKAGLLELFASFKSVLCIGTDGELLIFA